MKPKFVYVAVGVMSLALLDVVLWAISLSPDFRLQSAEPGIAVPIVLIIIVRYGFGGLVGLGTGLVASALTSRVSAERWVRPVIFSALNAVQQSVVFFVVELMTWLFGLPAPAGVVFVLGLLAAFCVAFGSTAGINLGGSDDGISEQGHARMGATDR
ncbi:hypothetical protein [Agromyces cerinus]|uniref:Uncharacterized protein n=1 Tax=Agromyces cerinus subsp. cerinus TaxID=232089 RepID=A0A1N6DR13_9MICO|nr:hypothetical protein [Agromyces cerinus]SIN73235.1 hypothetical protein SAMN05443544_0623 [Agromyces cerinus subsp. cerinus]